MCWRRDLSRGKMVRLGWWGGLDGVEGGGAVHCTSAMATCIKLLVIVLCALYCKLWGGYSGGL